MTGTPAIAVMVVLAVLAGACSDTAVVDDPTTTRTPAPTTTTAPATSTAPTTTAAGPVDLPNAEIARLFVDALVAGSAQEASVVARTAAVSFFDPWEPRPNAVLDHVGNGVFFVLIGPGRLYFCSIADGLVAGCLEETDESDPPEFNPSLYFLYEVLNVEPGGPDVVREGTVVSQEPQDAYEVPVFVCCSGETLNVAVTALEDNASFFIYGPDGSKLVADQTEATVDLLDRGPYLIVVGPTRGNATYTLSVSVAVPAS